MNKQTDSFINLSYILMTFSPLMMLSIGINLDNNIFIQILSILAISVLIRYLVLHKSLFIGILFLSIGLLIVVFWLNPSVLNFIKERFFDLLNNLINNLSGYENISRDNKLPLWVISAFFVSLLNALIVFKLRKKTSLILLYMPLFLIYWYNFYDIAFLLMTLFIFSFLMLHYNSNLRYFKTIFYYSLIIVSLSLLLPKTSNYISLDYLDEKVELIFPSVKKLRSAEGDDKDSKNAPYFDFSKTGFQQDPLKLGGPVVFDDTTIMEIRGVSVDYLRGNIRHTYTGSSWESILMDYKTVLNNTNLLSVPLEEMDLYREVDFSVKNLDFSSTTIFTPLYPLSVNIDKESYLLTNADLSIIYADGIYKNDGYFVKSLLPRAYGVQVDRGANKSLEDLDKLELYLQISDSITNRTRFLTSEIVEGLETDIEKAIAIEDYLRKNYVYNTDLPIPPDDIDFIDHFLFDKKEGYCTYFATAMTLMLRLENIPARYIEGFLVGPKDDDSVQTVRNRDAHTWVEAFIEPVGWTIFEPTPAYETQGRLLGFSPEDDIEGGSITDGKSRDPEDTRGRELDNSYLDGSLDGVFDAQSSPLSIFYLKVFLSLVFLYIIYKISVVVYTRIKKRKSYSSFSKTDKILYLYNDIVNRIEKLGYKKDPSETHFEYLDRIIYKFYDINKFSFKQATSLFVETKYGSYLPTDEDLEEMELYLNSLDEKLKNHLNPLRYYLQKWDII